MEKEIRQYTNAQLIPYFVEMINQGHTVTFKLKGFSMRPFLEDGRDKAILGKHTTVRCGDAVLAEISPKTYVLHRIVNIDGDKVTLDVNRNGETKQVEVTLGSDESSQSASTQQNSAQESMLERLFGGGSGSSQQDAA